MSVKPINPRALIIMLPNRSDSMMTHSSGNVGMMSNISTMMMDSDMMMSNPNMTMSMNDHMSDNMMSGHMGNMTGNMGFSGLPKKASNNSYDHNMMMGNGMMMTDSGMMMTAAEASRMMNMGFSGLSKKNCCDAPAGMAMMNVA